LAVSEPELHTTQLHRLVERIQAGDALAQNELVRLSGGRLEQLASSMLRRFPGVRRWEETGDLLQNALLRLLKSLEAVRPESTRQFFGLAAEQLRRELLDLARHYQGPHGLGAHHASGVLAPPTGNAVPGLDPADPAAAETAELERWQAFHEAVATLPEDEREVVALIYYHGWSRVQIAAFLHINERTVRRRWRSACLRLGEALGDDLPSP